MRSGIRLSNRAASVIEALESRTMFSVDLAAAALVSKLPDHVIAGEKITATAKATVSVSADSDAAELRSLKATVQFFLRSEGVVDASSDIALSKVMIVSGLRAGKAKLVTAKLTIPLGTSGGAYSLIAVVDGQNVIAESNEANNFIAAAGPTAVATPFVSLDILPVTYPFNGQVGVPIF